MKAPFLPCPGQPGQATQILTHHHGASSCHPWARCSQNCLPVPLLPGFKSKVRPARWRPR